MTNQAGNVGNQPHHAAHSHIPEIKIGTRILHGSHDITVSGVASGGMGLVAWGPNQFRNGKMEAVKLPKPDRLANASRDQRAAILADFEQEALTWCHLWAHHCIIAADSLLRVRELGDLPAIFLEYAPNGSLREWLQKVHRPGSTQTLGLEGVFAWGQMIAAALATIHQPDPELERPDPLVHCDLKPENVLVNERGWAMLTDLGLTRALASLADTAPQAGASSAFVGSVEMNGASEVSGLSDEQQEQVAQLRRLLAQAGIHPPVSPSATVSLSEDAVYGTRTICVSPAQQAALSAALVCAGEGSAQSEQHTPPALPALSPSATAMIAQMGSRGQVAGTPPYMAPEQWLGLNAVEPASDIYALGVMLFELFAGVGGRAGYPHIPDPLLTMTAGPFAAWCAAHASGPSRHLADAEVAALSDGPLVKLMQAGQQAQAEAVLAGLDALIEECLAVSPTMRPTAKQVQERLAALAAQAGLDPLTISEFPRTPEREAIFWENLGITYTEIGQPEKCLPLQRRAVALTPGNPLRQVNLGNVLAEIAMAEQKAVEEAARTGNHVMVLQLKAQARAHLEESVRAYQEAEAQLTSEWLERLPYLARGVPYNLGGTLCDLGRYAEAVVATERGLAADPTHAMSYRQLALTYVRWSREAETPAALRVERLEQAEAQMQRALDLAPHYGGGQALLDGIRRELAAARRA